MRTTVIAIVFFAICPLVLAQQTLNNDSVIKMVKMGFPQEMIINAINRSPGTYDTSSDGLVALKNAGVGSNVASAMALKGTARAPSLALAPPTGTAPPPSPPHTLPAATIPSAAQPAERPRVFITDSSSWRLRSRWRIKFGIRWALKWGARPQTAEIIKTFAIRRPSVVINTDS